MDEPEVVERILHAAVRGPDGLIFFGKSHADCFHQAYHIGIRGMSSEAAGQGFYTNKNRFVGRLTAFDIALAAGQIEPRKKVPLFSEDLWSPTDGGKYEYDSVMGYYLSVRHPDCSSRNREDFNDETDQKSNKARRVRGKKGL